MKSISLRVVSCLLLIAVIFMFTGLSTHIYAAPVEKAEKSCCDECSKTEGQDPDHCSTPDCPMFLCLSINTVSPFMPLNFWGSLYIPQFVEELRHKSFVRSIFHPPIFKS
jgi:hypothetical protein